MIKRQWAKEQEARNITEDRAARELASTHGDEALSKLKKEGTLQTRFAKYTFEN